jgi:hypothetical protein
MKLLGAKLRRIFAKFSEAFPPSFAKATEGSPHLHPRSKLRGIRRRRITRALKDVSMKKLLFAVCLVFVTKEELNAQTPYYQGKTVAIVVGTLAGDLYDLYARAIALFMGKYIAGNPNIIV